MVASDGGIFAQDNEAAQKLVQFLASAECEGRGPGIVYAPTRAKVEDIADKLGRASGRRSVRRTPRRASASVRARR